MSMDPGMISRMLASRLQQGPQGATAGGGAAGPAMQGQISPANAAASIVQKIMLMKALQNAPQTPGGATGRQQAQTNSMLPGTNAQIGADPTMQTLQQPPQMDPNLLLQLQQQQALQPPPNSMPTPGFS